MHAHSHACPCRPHQPQYGCMRISMLASTGHACGTRRPLHIRGRACTWRAYCHPGGACTHRARTRPISCSPSRRHRWLRRGALMHCDPRSRIERRSHHCPRARARAPHAPATACSAALLPPAAAVATVAVRDQMGRHPGPLHPPFAGRVARTHTNTHREQARSCHPTRECSCRRGPGRSSFPRCAWWR